MAVFLLLLRCWMAHSFLLLLSSTLILVSYQTLGVQESGLFDMESVPLLSIERTPVISGHTVLPARVLHYNGTFHSKISMDFPGFFSVADIFCKMQADLTVFCVRGAYSA